ncbi:hypothetical protein BgiMline_002608 [Biomphalaria glabrata]|nr:hypothetical protein BgiMline_011218 [Biomphalaria glabrata]
MSRNVLSFSHSGKAHHEIESQHTLLDHNKHLLLQIKMSVIFFVGGAIIVICLVYIVFQCRNKQAKHHLKQAHNRRPSEEKSKAFLGSNDTLENLLPEENTNVIPIKIRKDREFYV